MRVVQPTVDHIWNILFLIYLANCIVDPYVSSLSVCSQGPFIIKFPGGVGKLEGGHFFQGITIGGSLFLGYYTREGHFFQGIDFWGTRIKFGNFFLASGVIISQYYLQNFRRRSRGDLITWSLHDKLSVITSQATLSIFYGCTTGFSSLQEKKKLK